MHTNIMGRTLDKVVGDIEALDLEPIKFKLACQDDGPGWSAQHIERMAQAYKRFLILLARYPGVTIAPTRDIDTVWHTHILDTRKYAADCQHIFGEFLHHYPYLGLRGDQDRQQHAANALHDLFMQEFGEKVPANAGRRPAVGQPAADAAWCGREAAPVADAAWCGREAAPAADAAWCGREAVPAADAAWCGRQATPAEAAAWCGREAQGRQADTAWCGREAGAWAEAAWCGREAVTQEAPATEQAAWCGREART